MTNEINKPEKKTNQGKLNIATGGSMLYWAFMFFVIAIIAAIFGFGGIAVASAGIAKILFYIFLVLFVLSLIFHFINKKSNIHR